MKTKTLRYVLAAGLAALGSTVVADPALAWDTAACDPKGVTAADADLATALNSRLTANLRNALTGYRISCARMIVKTVRAGGWDPHAATIAVTTAIVETTLMNISEKVDHTSLGLFQQQDWWGSAKDRMNPVWTTNKFLSAMAAKHPDGKWLTDPIGKVCQEVQGSAYPTRYGENAADGKTVAEALWGIDDPVEKPDPHGTVYARSRSAGGTWQNSATRIDTNTAISGIAATRQQTDNSLHVFTVVPGSGIWHRKAWEADATRID
ncbi:MAG TPA: hypothetical protein VN408_32605, partial [Actinoplanes sp.]|nr:hypothetical protein [Actinoplanes sp.]